MKNFSKKDQILKSKETKIEGLAVHRTSENTLVHVDSALVNYSRNLASTGEPLDIERITKEERELLLED